jgi:hypothetical protein
LFANGVQPDHSCPAYLLVLRWHALIDCWDILLHGHKSILNQSQWLGDEGQIQDERKKPQFVSEYSG